MRISNLKSKGEIAMTLQEVNDAIPWILDSTQIVTLILTLLFLGTLFYIIILAKYFNTHVGKYNFFSKISVLIIPCLIVLFITSFLYFDKQAKEWVDNYGQPYVDENSDTHKAENIHDIDIIPNSNQATVIYLSKNTVSKANMPYQIKADIEEPYVEYQTTDVDFYDISVSMPKKGEVFNEILYIPTDY